MTRPDHPQRLAPPTPPGALLKRLQGIHHRLKLKDAGQRDPIYLGMIRQMPCLHCGMEPCYEAAHVRMSSGAHHKTSGMRKKPADKWAVPLCPDHHRLARDCQHARGEELFWDKLGVNPLLVCERLHSARGDLVQMRAIVLTAIAERN